MAYLQVIERPQIPQYQPLYGTQDAQRGMQHWSGILGAELTARLQEHGFRLNNIPLDRDGDGVTARLYHGDNVVLQSNAQGVDVYDPSGNDGPRVRWHDDENQLASMFVFSSDLFIDHQVNSGHIEIRGRDIGGTTRSMLEFDPDLGVNIIRSQGQPYLAFFESVGGARVGFLQMADGSNDDCILRNESNSGHVYIQGKNAAGTVATFFNGDPDGRVFLYDDGAIAGRTTSVGWAIRGSSAGDDDNVRLYFEDLSGNVIANIGYYNSDVFRMRNTHHGGAFYVELEDSGGVVRQVMRLHYTGNVGCDFNMASGDFTVVDVDSSPTNIIWYDHSADTLYLGADAEAQIDCRAAVMVGSPTGGWNGAGTINAEAVYDDNSLLTDYVFDAELDGRVDPEKWDSAVPDRRRRPKKDEADYDPRNPDKEIVTVRRHEPARRFAQRVDELDPEVYCQKWRATRKLPAFAEPGTNGDFQLSVGEIAQRLLETAEVNAVHIDRIVHRLMAVEDELRLTRDAQAGMLDRITQLEAENDPNPPRPQPERTPPA